MSAPPSAAADTSTNMASSIKMVAFEHGAAGHQGISTDDSGSLLIKPCTQAEIDFYSNASAHPEFFAHLPTFMGSLTQGQPEVQKPSDTTTEQSASEGKKDWVPSGGAKLSTGLAIVLSNATSGFKHPNVLDVKLGARLWDDDAPVSKRQKLDDVSNETTSGSLGFRVAGMKVYTGTKSEKAEVNTTLKDGYKTYDKFYGRTLNDGNVNNAFIRFVGGDEDGVVPENRQVVVQRVLQRIKDIQNVLENQESRMYSASILMVCEGDQAAAEEALKAEGNTGKSKKTQDEDEDDEDEEEQPKLFDVRLIDFAHAHWTPGQGPDENALKGVRNVVRILEEISAK